MTSEALLFVAVGALWGVSLALVGVVWAMLRERIAALESRTADLMAQNTGQETAIGRLQEGMLAREKAHGEHREHIADAIARVEVSVKELSLKIDRLTGSRTPYPGRYGGGEGKVGE